MVDGQSRRGFFGDGFCMDDSLLFFFLLLVILFCNCDGFGRC
jgi:hypothetical protein